MPLLECPSSINLCQHAIVLQGLLNVKLAGVMKLMEWNWDFVKVKMPIPHLADQTLIRNVLDMKLSV